MKMLSCFLRYLALAAGLAVMAHGATPLSDVQVSGANNQVKSGARLTILGTLTIDGNATFSMPWSRVDKTGSSLADLTTRSASDISSGVLGSIFGGAGSITGLMKANGSGVVSAAVSGTDYAPATSGSLLLSGNGAGAFTNVTLTGLTLSAGALAVNADAGLPAQATFGGSFLTTNGTASSWSPLPIGNSTTAGILKVDGTTITASAGVISAAAQLPAQATFGGDFLTTNGTVSSWTALPVGSATTAGILKVDGTTITASGGVISSTGGGMSNPMTTAADLIVGGASGAPTRLGVGTNGQVLKVASGVITWGTDATGTGTLPATPATGDLLYYDGTNWVSRAIGTPNQVLSVSSSLPAWSAGSMGSKTIYVPAAAMSPSITSGCQSLNVVETTAGDPDLATLDFDPSTEQYAQFSVSMPKSWNLGTVTVVFIWSHASTTTNFGVVWAAQAVDVSASGAIGVAFGTAQTVTSTGGTTNTLYISSATSAITAAGTPTSGDQLFFRVYRKAADASDTLAINARLHGVRIIYTTNAPNDN